MSTKASELDLTKTALKQFPHIQPNLLCVFTSSRSGSSNSRNVQCWQQSLCDGVPAYIFLCLGARVVTFMSGVLEN